MQKIAVDSRTFCFDDSWLVMKYDETPFYKNHLRNSKGLKKSLKGVDLIAFDQRTRELFLIESKDYRVHKREKKTPLEEEFFKKVLDTLTGILPTCLCSVSRVNGEDVLNKSVTRAKKIRLVFQLELSLTPDVLANLQIKLRQELRIFDPHVLVINSNNQYRVAWNVI